MAASSAVTKVDVAEQHGLTVPKELPTTKATKAKRKYVGVTIVAIAVLIGVALCAFAAAEPSFSDALLRHAEELKGWRLIAVLSALNVLVNVLPVGGAPLITSAAAFFYGLVPACGLIMVTKLAAVLGIFLVGQRTFKGCVRDLVATYPRLYRHVRAAEQNWRAILVVRLMPLPAGVSNMAFAASNVRLLPYLGLTALGSTPYILQAAVFGTAARDVTDLRAAGHSDSGEATAERVPMRYRVLKLAALSVFAVVLVAFTLKMAERARLMLETYPDAAEQQKLDDGEGEHCPSDACAVNSGAESDGRSDLDRTEEP